MGTFQKKSVTPAGLAPSFHFSTLKLEDKEEIRKKIEENSKWNNLMIPNKDCLIEIFQRLQHPKDLKNIALSCKLFSEVISSFHFWKIMCQKEEYFLMESMDFEKDTSATLRRKYFDSFLPISLGMKLEARDIKHPILICVATITEIDDSKSKTNPTITITFDGWGSEFDYTQSLNGGNFGPLYVTTLMGRTLQPPYLWEGQFNWPSYLESTKSKAVPKRCFERSTLLPFDGELTHRCTTCDPFIHELKDRKPKKV